MTASHIVDKLIEDGPIDPGEFLADFPIKRAQSSDFTTVVAKINRLKAEHGGWGDGDINVTTWGGDPIERYDSSWLNDPHFRAYLDFDAAVVDHNGDVIQQGIAQENPCDTFYGWQTYLDFTGDPVLSAVTFGKNDADRGTFEPGMPPEVEAVCQKHWNEFKAKFIDPALWLVESHGKRDRAKWRKKLTELPSEVQAADEFYRGYLGGVEPGEKIKSAGALAAYTHDWPEYSNVILYGRNHKDEEAARDFIRAPNEQWKDYYQGTVAYEGRPLYVKGKGRYNWKVEWYYGSGNNYQPMVQVDLELWDRDRIWKSHWKKPILWDYKRVEPRGSGSQADWDEANPDVFDTQEFDTAIKDKLVAQAKAFVEKLGQVASFTKVRWNVPELYVQESSDDLLKQMRDVASKNRYIEFLNLFCTTYKRLGGDSFGPEEDVQAWRPIIIRLGLDEAPSRAIEIMDAGYDLLRGDLDFDDAWLDAVGGLVVDQKVGVSDEDYDAVKRLWAFRYRDEDAFMDHIAGLMEGPNPTLVENRRDKSGKGFTQIGGDFGSPWDYGGTWFNEETSQLIHFPGRDDEREIESSDTKVDAQMQPSDYKAVLAAVTLEKLGDWENVEDDIRLDKSTALNEARRYYYYSTVVDNDEWIDRDWAKEIAEIKREQELDDEAWAALPAAQKEASIADRIGWHEFDHSPEKINRKELAELLGVDL